MSTFSTLWKREMQSYLYTGTAGMVGAFFLVITGFSFWLLTHVLAQGEAGVDVMKSLFASSWYWLAAFTVTPLITMGLFAGERRMGTLELLLTTPVTECGVVLSKFFAALSLYILFWAVTVFYALILQYYSTELAPIDFGAMAAGYMGTILVGAFAISLGLLCSLFSRHHVIAAMMSMAVLGILLSVSLLSELARSPAIRELVRYVSMPVHMMDFSRGIVDSRALVYYLSSTALLLFSSVRILETQRLR